MNAMTNPTTQPTAFEPHYQANIAALAEELRRAHGGAALDCAITRMHQHLGASA